MAMTFTPPELPGGPFSQSFKDTFSQVRELRITASNTTHLSFRIEKFKNLEELSLEGNIDWLGWGL
jgi:hypothetical protein